MPYYVAMYYFYLLLFFLSSSLFAQTTSVKQIPEYQKNIKPGEVILYMSYASAKVKNKDSWDNTNKVVKEIDLIFTNYPKKKEDWITNYDSLLSWRKKAIAELIPETSNTNIKWNIILQTSCKTESEAKKMFHGAVLHYYRPISKKKISHKLLSTDSSKTHKIPASEIQEPYTLEDLVKGNVAFPDSIVLKVFDRHPEWHNMLIVNDWTGSMYEYGAQTVLWHQKNLEKKAVKALVFFNDGNRKDDYDKRIGKTGGVYFCNSIQLEKTLDVMKKVMMSGDGGDLPENDVEALIEGIKKTKKFGEVILIADNKSHVRDIVLASRIKVPVRIILCGSYHGAPILPDYVELARITQGSIHTIDEDITNLHNLSEGQIISIQGVTYKFRYGRLEKIFTQIKKGASSSK